MSTLTAIMTCIAVLTATGASAHYVYYRDIVWSNDYWCTSAYAEISHGQFNKGYLDASTEAKHDFETPYGTYNCQWRSSRPAEWLKVKAVVFKYDAAAKKWGVCAWTDYKFNAKPATTVGVKHHFARTYCSKGWYRTQARSYMKVNGKWQGGRIYSNGSTPSSGHYLPVASSGDPAEALLYGDDDAAGSPDVSPPLEAWDNADGTTNVEMEPDFLPLIGSDGRIVRSADGTEVVVPNEKEPEPAVPDTVVYDQVDDGVEDSAYSATAMVPGSRPEDDPLNGLPVDLLVETYEYNNVGPS